MRLRISSALSSAHCDWDIEQHVQVAIAPSLSMRSMRTGYEDFYRVILQMSVVMMFLGGVPIARDWPRRWAVRQASKRRHGRDRTLTLSLVLSVRDIATLRRRLCCLLRPVCPKHASCSSAA